MFWGRRWTSLWGTELLLPLFSEAFWDDSGHTLNIAGDQGAMSAWRTKLTEDPDRPSVNCLGKYWEFAGAEKKKGNKVNQKQEQAATGQMG